MLTFLDHYHLILIEIVLRCSHIDVCRFEASITDIDNIDGLSCGEHSCQGITTFACGSHNILLSLPCLVQFCFALHREDFFLDHFAGFIGKLIQVMIFNETG